MDEQYFSLESCLRNIFIQNGPNYFEGFIAMDDHDHFEFFPDRSMNLVNSKSRSSPTLEYSDESSTINS